MAILAFLFGIILAGCGGASLYFGFDILTSERGLALSLCGTVAISAGLILLVQGFALLQSGRILAALKIISASNLLPVVPVNSTESHTTDNHAEMRLPDPANELQSEADEIQPEGQGTIPARPKITTRATLGTLAAGTGLAAVGAALATGLPSMGHAEEDSKQSQHPEPEVIPAENIAGENNAGEHLATDLQALTASEALEMRPTIHPVSMHDTSPTPGHSPVEVDDLDELLDELATDTKGKQMSVAQDALPESLPKMDPAADAASQKHQDMADDAIADLEDMRPNQRKSPSEVIGSYDSAGVTYTLYADSSVTAQAGETREHYPTLEALREAFENGKSQFSTKV